jgi:pyrroloquinoline quinone biosynthesis protein B
MSRGPAASAQVPAALLLATTLLAGCTPDAPTISDAPTTTSATTTISDAPTTAGTPTTAGAPTALAGPHLVVLGIAQDAGHPQAGCTRACCRRQLTEHAPGHRVASLGLVDGDRRFVVDATPDLRRQLGHLSPSGRLDGVLLTHAHIGHYTGLVHLGREAMGADAVPVWAMPRMRAFLASDRPWSLLVDQGHVALRELTADTPIPLTDAVRVTPFLVPHRDEISETVGFRFEGPERTVVYLPDIDKWARWDTPVEDLVRSADVALLDGTFYGDGEVARDMAQIPHPFVVESLQRLGALPAQERAKVRFIHLNHTNPLLDPSSEASDAVRDAGFGVAREGDVLPL